jgi:hypothetical protein
MPDEPHPATLIEERRGTTLLRAWGGFLHEFAWDHCATLTFRYPVQRDIAIKELCDRFLRRLGRNAQRPIACFWAIERGGGQLHIHALIAGTVKLASAGIYSAWQAGYSKVSQYDPSRGAAWYVTKGLFGRCEEYGLTRRMPRHAGPADYERLKSNAMPGAQRKAQARSRAEDTSG